MPPLGGGGDGGGTLSMAMPLLLAVTLTFPTRLLLSFWSLSNAVIASWQVSLSLAPILDAKAVRASRPAASLAKSSEYLEPSSSRYSILVPVLAFLQKRMDGIGDLVVVLVPSARVMVVMLIALVVSWAGPSVKPISRRVQLISAMV